jgi:hypothetical protein
LRESKEELKKVNKLLNIAKPASLPVHLSGDIKKVEKELPPIIPDDNKQESLPKLTDSSSSSENKIPFKFSLNNKNTKLQESDFNTGSKKPSKLTTNEIEKESVLKQPTAPQQQINKSPSTKQKEIPVTDKLQEQEHSDQEDEDENPDNQKSESESDEDVDDVELEEDPKNKKKRRQRQKVKKETKYDYDKSDPKYSTWVPPTDQRGDGRTSLNEKLGY